MKSKFGPIVLIFTLMQIHEGKTDEAPAWQCWRIYPDMPTPSMKYVNFGPLEGQYNCLGQKAASDLCNLVPLYSSCNGHCKAFPAGETPSWIKRGITPPYSLVNHLKSLSYYYLSKSRKTQKLLHICWFIFWTWYYSFLFWFSFIIASFSLIKNKRSICYPYMLSFYY